MSPRAPEAELDSEVIFFERPEELRAWLDAHHADTMELWVGFYKRSTNRPSLTWPESVDEALCYGWIDGIRKSIDGESYKIRFTPRKARSTWSTVNVGRVAVLAAEGRMKEAGLAAFAARSEDRTGIYSHEQSSNPRWTTLEKRLIANKRAHTFWKAQTPSYRKAASWWVVSAKRDETRERRFAELVDRSSKGETIPQFTRRS